LLTVLKILRVYVNSDPSSVKGLLCVVTLVCSWYLAISAFVTGMDLYQVKSNSLSWIDFSNFLLKLVLLY
jgi:hypothetical protein